MADQATVMAAELLAEKWRGEDGAVVCRCCDAPPFDAIEAFADHLDSARHLSDSSDLPEVREAWRIWATNLNPEWTKNGMWPHLG